MVLSYKINVKFTLIILKEILDQTITVDSADQNFHLIKLTEIILITWQMIAVALVYKSQDFFREKKPQDLSGD